MRARLRGGMAAAFIAAAVVAVPGQASATPGCEWRAVPLPTPPGVTSAGVNAADGNGWFAGWASWGGGPFDDTPVLRWHGDGTAEDLGLPFGRPVNVYGVSPSGIVVGAVVDEGFTLSAVQYRDGKWERLPKLGDQSWAYDVNATGDVVVADDGPEPESQRLVVWPGGDFGAPRHLTLPAQAWRTSPPPAIDDDGTVVANYGRLVGNTFTPYGWVWQPGAATPTQLQLPEGDSWTTVADIRGGHIVGASHAEDGTVTGVEWDISGQLVRKFAGDPVAVNREGLVTGRENQGDWVVWLPDASTEPMVLPAGFDSMWPTSFGDEAVGGRVLDGSTSVPTAWHRHC